MEKVTEENKNRAEVISQNIASLNTLLEVNVLQIDIAQEHYNIAKKKLNDLEKRREELQDDRAKAEAMLRGEGD